jgi:hypothetical protein
MQRKKAITITKGHKYEGRTIYRNLSKNNWFFTR